MSQEVVVRGLQNLIRVVDNSAHCRTSVTCSAWSRVGFRVPPAGPLEPGPLEHREWNTVNFQQRTPGTIALDAGA